MTNHLHSSLKIHREEKQNLLTEVTEKEKHMLMLIHNKGLMHSDAKELYLRVRSDYERIMMCENEKSELQDLEYCLWKLHYKHIDEFRKRTTKCPNPGTKSCEEFKLFLSEATEFYQNLIVKIRKCYGLPDESSFYRRDDVASLPEQKRIKQCHFLCHRFLVCLGDLARYREQFEKPDARNRNWSMAATYYMEATAIWPDSGNPQNQLAVLATYIGDEFLALYHCIRSLAVKEPFPDAQDNLLVLLEKNRSSFPQTLWTEAQFDFSNPSHRAKPESTLSSETNVWSHFIRLISFFFLKSSFDDFPSVFALTVRELDKLMAFDDKALNVALESYKQMDSVKTGPFQPLQAVCILLYSLQAQVPDDTRAKMLLTAAFIFVGRFVDRCLESAPSKSCPLLPAVLIFVEWLAKRFDEHETPIEAKEPAATYFFGSLAELVKRLGAEDSSNGFGDVPLWEDYELRGFTPTARHHEPLDWESVDSFEKGSESRSRRLISAGQQIMVKAGFRPDDEEVILFSPFTAPAISAGPPSLSMWVLEAKEATPAPIQVPALVPVSVPVPDPSPVYTVPSPSAPLLPEDAAWYQNWVPATVAGPVVGHRQMTSSEWLRHYLQTQQAAAATPAAQSPLLSPNYYYYYNNSPAGAAAGVETPPPLYTVLPLDYAAEMQRREAAAAAAVGELQAQPLLQYLKERERQLQGLYDPNGLMMMMMRGGPTYM